MMKSINLSGLIAAPFTPFDSNGELAIAQVATLANLYVNNGVTGAFISGSTGEGASLTLEEKKQLMRAWGKTNADIHKVFFVGGTCMKDMQDLASRAADEGMDAISVLSPYYFKPSSIERLVDFCAEVAAVNPALPLYYYHIPALSGGFFKMSKFLELAEERIPNLLGIKFTYSDLLDFQNCKNYKNGKYQMLWGTDEALLSGLIAGAQGGVGSTYNYAAPLYNEIIKEYNSGNIDNAKALQAKSVAMVNLLIKYGGAEAGKAFMKLIGVDCGWFRSPFKPIRDNKLSMLKDELQEIGFFEFCNKL